MLRAAASAVITSSLLLTAAGPAAAAEPAPDTTPPVIVSTGLTEGQYIRPFHRLVVTATDDVAPVAVEVIVNGEPPGGAYGLYNGQLLAQIPLVDIADDAEVKVGIRVRDAAWNWSETVTTKVLVDRVVPTATISPADEFLLVGRSLTFTASDVPVDTRSIVMYDRDDRELARATAAPWKLPLNTADLGTVHSVRISIVDRATNQTDYYRFFDIDTTGPEISIESQVPGVMGPGMRPVLGFAEDRAGVARAEWWVDGAVRGRNLDQLNYDFGTRERTVTVELRVWDKLGNVTVGRYPFKVDTQAPTLVSHSPAANTRVRGTTLQASLRVSDPSGVGWVMTDEGYGPVGTSPYTARFRLGPDGKHNLGWLVADVWGNERKIYQTVIVDNTGPSVGWLSPGNNALVRGSKIASSVKASDAAGVRSATLSGAKADTLAPYAASIAAGKDGKKTLTWTVLDKLGNPTTVRRTVIVDNTKASLKVTKAPGNKAKVSGTVKMTASASDKNGVAKVQLLVNGKVVATDAKAAYTFAVNTKKYGKTIKIQLRAYDRAGNVTTTATRTWYRK
ncbi:Ig-like domain-containing protein [Actinoplanes sp. NPDC023936]|uniref:Ig-like domain-containing protein n=1 Tax=Actinoplanes sp. NPDC023936 TaxID=3154910 RepID=UPI0033EBEC60